MGYVSTDLVAAAGTPEDVRLRAQRMVPLGAAVWTGAGRLAERGITAIVHAASGAMGRTGAGYDPTRESVTASIGNAFRLTRGQGRGRLALPFIAGGIFASRIRPPLDKAELARLIVDACAAQRGGNEAVLVAFGAADLALFQRTLAAAPDSGIRLCEGSLTDVGVHGAAVIANAANMEVVFGGGISGVIGEATGDPAAIEAEAARAVAAFWAANPARGGG